jgi:hypothetical protein
MDESRIGMKKPWIGGSGGNNAKTLRSKGAAEPVRTRSTASLNFPS